MRETRRKSPRRGIVKKLDLAEHASRLRAIPATPAEVLRQVLVWFAAGVLLVALGWLALGR